jgi:hypothetical protein
MNLTSGAKAEADAARATKQIADFMVVSRG